MTKAQVKAASDAYAAAQRKVKAFNEAALKS